MDVEWNVGCGLAGLDDGRAIAEVGDEVPIHNVDVDIVSARDAVQVAREVGHIGGED